MTIPQTASEWMAWHKAHPPKPPLSDYALPEKPLPCHYCKGSGGQILKNEDGAEYASGLDCRMCLGSGHLLCIGYGEPGCLGYATDTTGDDCCAYHLTHCTCGEPYLVVDGEPYCVKCDALALTTIPMDKIVEAAKAAMVGREAA